MRPFLRRHRLAATLGLAVILSGCAIPPAQTKVERSVSVTAVPVNDVNVTAQKYELRVAGRVIKNGDTYGSLRFLEVIKLKGDNPDFGGFSAIVFDGSQLIGQTDKAKILRLRLDPAAPLTQQFPQKARFVSLADQNKTALKNEQEVDSEALVLLNSATGLVAFERRHRIARHDLNTGQLLSDGGSVLLIPEKVLKTFPNNGGFEAFTRLADGRYLAIAEGNLTSESYVYALLWDTKGNPKTLRYRRTEAFKVTDALALANGDVLALERDFDLPRQAAAGRVVRFRAQDLNKNEIMPQELLRFGFDSEIDNLEGLAAAPNTDGSFTLLIISDDNFNPFQETVLSRWVYRP